MLATGDNQIQVRLETSETDYTIDQNVFSLPHTASISELQDLIKSLLNIVDDSIEFSFRINDELLSTSIGKFCESSNFSGESVLKVEYFLKRQAPEKTDEVDVNDWVGGLCFSAGSAYAGLYNGQLARITHSLATNSYQVHGKPIKCVQTIRAEKEGDLVVTGSMDQSLVYSVVGEEECKAMFSLRGHTETVTCVAVSPSTEQIASGSYDTMLKVWSTDLDQPDEDKKRKKKRKEGEGALRTPLLTLGGHSQAVTGCCWKDNSQVVTVSMDMSVKFWDTQMMSCTKTIAIATALQSVAWSDKSRLLATGASDRYVRLFDPRGASGALVHSTLIGHELWVPSVSWSQDSEYELISGSYDNSVLLWDTRSPKSYLQRISSHEDKVLSVAWDRGQILSGGADSKVHLSTFK